MVSSDMEEVIGMSDRVVVMHERRIKGILAARRAHAGAHRRADDRAAPTETEDEGDAAA